MITVTNQARQAIRFVIESDYPDFDSIDQKALFDCAVESAADGGFTKLSRSEARYIVDRSVDRALSVFAQAKAGR